MFQARYLSKWSSQVEGIEDRAVTEWSRGLSGLNGDQIKCGIDRWVSIWPPSLPEFYKACIGGEEKVEEKWQHKTLAYIPSPGLKALPKPRNKVLAKKEMEKIRKLLNS